MAYANGRKLTEEQVLRAVQESSGTYWDIARRLGISRRSAQRYLVDYFPEIEQVRLDVLERNVDVAEEQLFKHVREGNLKAIMFVLQTLGKKRGYVLRQETEQVGRVVMEVEYSDGTVVEMDKDDIVDDAQD
mgnify:CR=1 FL=1